MIHRFHDFDEVGGSYLRLGSLHAPQRLYPAHLNRIRIDPLQDNLPSSAPSASQALVGPFKLSVFWHVIGWRTALQPLAKQRRKLKVSANRNPEWSPTCTYQRNVRITFIRPLT
jgi:hypothetical protein